MPYAQLIVNPIAGAGKTARKWPQIMGLLENMGLDFEHELTEAPGHAIELAKSATNRGCELVISVGGDGTINEIVNGLYGTDGINDVMLGIINTGTGADYIRTIGIPRTYKEACECLLKPRKLTVDLGVVECTNNGHKVERLFVNFAGLGFDAEIVRATTQKFKALGDVSSYLMGLLTTVVSYQNKEVLLVLDGEAERKKVCTVLMSHGKYGGGGMLTTPDADPGDGLFDVLIIDDLTKPDLLWSLPRVYKGTHLSHPKVTVKRAQEIEVRPVLEMCIQADGEIVGEAPARFHVLPAALNIIV